MRGQTDGRTDGWMDGWSEETEERARCWNGLYIEIEKRMSEPGEFPNARGYLAWIIPGKPANASAPAFSTTSDAAVAAVAADVPRS